MQSLIRIVILFSIIHRTTSEEWNYGDFGPDVWSDTYPLCSGRSQSPINIRTACATYESFAPFQFSSTYNLSLNFKLRNNGHTVAGTYAGNGSTPLTITGGGLDGTFHFINFHLHWGENYKSGSEHQINGMKYAGEIHFVHANPATGKFAVLGVFMESSKNTNINETVHFKSKRDDTATTTDNTTIEEWKRYFAVAENLQHTNNSAMISLNLASLMGDNLDDFWRYQGSLTTPPCTEGIIWTVFRAPTLFTDSELAEFRKNIFYEDFRGPQPLYDRIVYKNFPEVTTSSIPDYNQCCSNNAARIRLNQILFSFRFIQGFEYILSFVMILFYCNLFS